MNLHRTIALALALWGFCGAQVQAQNAAVMPNGCGTANYSTGGTKSITQDTTGLECVGAVAIPSGGTSAGITPVVSASAEATKVLKSSAGNLYGVYATNLTATSGFLAIVNLTAAPADGAIVPLACVPLAGNSVASISYAPGPPAIYDTGITAIITSATTCFTKTTGVITGYIGGAVK